MRREIAEDEGVHEVPGVTDTLVVAVADHHCEHAKVADQRYGRDDHGRPMGGGRGGVPGELGGRRRALHRREDRVAAVAAFVDGRRGGHELLVPGEPRRRDPQLVGAADVGAHRLAMAPGEVLVLLGRGWNDGLCPMTTEQPLAPGGPSGA